MQKIIKEAFVVIGKEGSTLDGAGFIQKLWHDANSHFSEVEHLAKRTQREISWAYGVPCLTFYMHSCHGKMAFPMVCIWQAWNALLTQKHLKAGQNGRYQVMST